MGESDEGAAVAFAECAHEGCELATAGRLLFVWKADGVDADAALAVVVGAVEAVSGGDDVVHAETAKVVSEDVEADVVIFLVKAFT